MYAISPDLSSNAAIIVKEFVYRKVKYLFRIVISRSFDDESTLYIGWHDSYTPWCTFILVTCTEVCA